jgi:succinate dehydrogenase/fumarate reductase flavoprotein subunit
MRTYQIEFDVVVIGYGCAGACAAIHAAEAGARVLLVEKMPHHGGLTMLCSGYLRVATDAAKAAAYLKATNGGRASPQLIQVLAEGMTEIPRFMEELARTVKARVHLSIGDQQAPYETSDLYDWPGKDALGWAGVEEVPEFAGYPWVYGGSRGQLLMRTLEANVNAHGIEVWLNSAARSLVMNEGMVTGVTVEQNGRLIKVDAKNGVILACGGFEFNQEMLKDWLELPMVHPMGHPGNTGDGIRMATQAGASLWHLWHMHASYGFKVPEFPVAFRNHLGGSRREQRAVAWIVVDQRGRRFMNEVPRAPQDTAARPLAHLDSDTGRFDRIPAWMIFDDAARQLGPIAKPIASVPEHWYDWSSDNLREVKRGWLLAGRSIRELAHKAGLDADELGTTVDGWNAGVAAGRDIQFDRPTGTNAPISSPPFYAIQVWPVVSNTQGGPKHDEFQRVLDAQGHPLRGLYSVGELGSFFGHIYMLGGNLTEGLVGGRIAGRRAAAGLDNWKRVHAVAMAGI